MTVNRELCFVIMPFGRTTDEHTEEYWADHFDFLKSRIEENPNLEARRSEALRGDILGEIITKLVSSRVVVADLTDHNSNVYWELGVRQSFKHGTITIAEAGTKLPFDVGGKGTLFYYPKHHLKMEEFIEQFKKAIQDCLEHPDIPDSRVLETLSGRGTLFEIFRKDEALRRLDALLSECDRNSIIFTVVVETVQKNQKAPPNKSEFVTHRLRSAAVDLLVTNRYIDEDLAFFGLAESYATSTNAINEQLNSWQYQQDATEEWLIKNNDVYMKRFLEFKAKVEAAREKLNKRF